ncbi:restriction system protein [Kitasatospora sp. MAA4]|uniref:restriction endonuclease n=1 Tax=Kitasatospora sp. MAA4 TaxID=3035093 RepID=UPI002474EF5F|nr:restriction endonuclease [Kitasatospora sp. MAA4]MDH6136726.1 restriction system protein [Kitasatospora sp. MAA4]
MAGRRNNGVLAVWAEAQRQEQRRRDAQRRAEVAAQRQLERQAREAERAAVRGEREALKAYQLGREAEAARRTTELDEQVRELQGLLVAGLAQPGFRADALLAPVRLPAFDRIAQVREQLRRLRAGEPEAVQEYFTAALYGSTGWPEDFPRRLTAAWDPSTRQLAVSWELPPLEVVPATTRVRYVKSDDRENEIARPAAERRRLYREVLAQSALRVLHELFRADREEQQLASVALSGFVDGVDPATGRQAERVLLAVNVGRADFSVVELNRVAPVDCLEGLGGRLSARPDRLEEVRAERLPEPVEPAAAAYPDDPEGPDLFAMDPIAFEELIAELFKRRGFRVMTTARSGDQGVDVLAEDLDPLTGGKIVIQAKRYRHTVPPTAVRDLDSTVRHHGARQGILVTTAGFGRGSYSYIQGKPLSLVTGPELVRILAEHGLPGRLGGPPATTPALEVEIGWQEHGPGGARVELDVCAFLCAGGRLVDDEHFVFFNNLTDPSGAVSLSPDGTAAPGGTRSVRLSLTLDRLASGVDEVALAVATDEQSPPPLPLGSVRGLTLTARGGEPVRWQGDTAGVPQSAMVLGSFRRGPAGWHFDPSGATVPGGLLGLARRWDVTVG